MEGYLSTLPLLSTAATCQPATAPWLMSIFDSTWRLLVFLFDRISKVHNSFSRASEYVPAAHREASKNVECILISLPFRPFARFSSYAFPISFFEQEIQLSWRCIFFD